MNVDIKITGVNRIENKLRYMISSMPDIVDVEVADWSRDMAKLLKGTPYPSKRPGQNYVRTGQLANRWRVSRQKSASYNILNDARGRRGRLYAGYVVGSGGDQAWMHTGRWWIARDVINGFSGDLTRRMVRRINLYWQQ